MVARMKRSIMSVSGKILSFEIDIPKQGIDLKAHPELCPLSLTKGKKMRQKTLTNHVYPKYWDLVKIEGYYMCDVVDCPVVYYNNHVEHYFGKEDVRAPVAHKMHIQADGRPLCYCMGVLEQTILEELLIKQCCDSLKDIQEFTKANKGRDCAITNPAGRCCGSLIKKTIEWAQKQRLEISPPLLEEAISCCEEIEKATTEEKNE